MSTDTAIANSAMTTIHTSRERATMDLARNLAEIAALQRKYTALVAGKATLTSPDIALANMYQRQVNVLNKKNAVIEKRLAGFDQTEIHLETVRGNKDLVEARRSLDAYADTGSVDPAALLEAEDTLGDKLRIHEEIADIIVGEQETPATDGIGLAMGSLYATTMEQVVKETEAFVSLGIGGTLSSGSRPGSGDAGILREDAVVGVSAPPPVPVPVPVLVGASTYVPRPPPPPPPSVGSGSTSFLDF